jgi:hypothetical protein
VWNDRSEANLASHGAKTPCMEARIPRREAFGYISILMDGRLDKDLDG